MVDFDISSISDNISRVCYVTTVFFNTLLIYLTMNHTKQIVGTYRTMIVTFALFGIWFSTSDILVRPLLHSYNGGLIYFTLGSTFRSSKLAAQKALLLYSTMYGVIMTFLAVQFKYRGCVLAKQKWVKYFDGWKLIIWVAYTFFNGGVWAISVYLMSPDENTHNYMQHEMMVHYGVNIRNIPYFMVLAFNGEGPTKTLRWNSVCAISIMVTLLIIQYTTCLICGIIMYRKIRKKLPTSSSQHERLQRQFFVALMYQVVTPCICFHIPSLFVFVIPFFDMKFSFHSTLLIYGFNIYPLLDSLILLSVVSEYKMALKMFFKFLLKEWEETIGHYHFRIPEPSMTVVMTRLG